jgi:hypothetical protein
MGPSSSTASHGSPTNSELRSRTSSGRAAERLSGPDAAHLPDVFAEAERLASAGKLPVARRVESSNIWRRSGHRSPAAHIAEATDTGIGPANTALEAARPHGSLPATDEAVRPGGLSETPVKEIGGAAILQPEAEPSLVDAAGRHPLHVLKLRCRGIRAAGQDSDASYEAIRPTRCLAHWVADNGAVRSDARLTPDAGARVIATVAAEVEQLAAAFRRAGPDEPWRGARRPRKRVTEEAPPGPPPSLHRLLPWE